MTFEEFVAKYKGQKNVGNTTDNKGQCVGLVMVWFEAIKTPHIWGHAMDLLKNADKEEYEVIANTPDAVPQKGDVVVWRKGFNGTFGHTAIATGKGDTKTFEVFEQNNPLGSDCHFRTYNYSYVEGWLRPKNPTLNQVSVDGDTFQKLVSNSTKYDEFVAAGYTTIQDVLKKVEEANNNKNSVTEDLKSCENRNISLAEELKKLMEENSAAIDQGFAAQKERDEMLKNWKQLEDSVKIAQETIEDRDDEIEVLKAKLKLKNKEIVEQIGFKAAVKLVIKTLTKWGKEGE